MLPDFRSILFGAFLFYTNMIKSDINYLSTENPIILRKEFLFICNFDHCQAILLAYYDFRFSEIYSKNRENIQKEIPVYEEDWLLEISPMQLKNELLGLFGRTKIIESNLKLEGRGFIKIFNENKISTKISIYFDEINYQISKISSLVKSKKLSKILLEENIKHMSSECLYLIHDKSRNLLKIGKSFDVNKRLSSYKSTLGDCLEIIYNIPNHGAKEKEVLLNFSPLNSHGEWFNFSEDIVKYFENLSKTQQYEPKR